MRRSNNVLQKEAALPEMGIDILNRVANAARSTLESAILLDPLIAAHAPTLKAVMEGFANNASLEGLLPPPASKTRACGQVHQRFLRE